jgi:hypothetical protein
MARTRKRKPTSEWTHEEYESALLVGCAQHVFDGWSKFTDRADLKAVKSADTLNLMQIAAARLDLRNPAVAAGFLLGFEFGDAPHQVIELTRKQTKELRLEISQRHGRRGSDKRHNDAKTRKEEALKLFATIDNAKVVGPKVGVSASTARKYRAAARAEAPLVRIKRARKPPSRASVT